MVLRASAVVAAVALLVLVGWLLWPVALDKETGPALSAFATAMTALIGLMAAVASAVAAVAAMRAARQSDETSRRAIEALGLAMEPTLDATIAEVRDGRRPDLPPGRLIVWNKSRWVATDVVVDVDPAYGPKGVYRIDRLEPSTAPKGKLDLSTWFSHPVPGNPPEQDDPDWRGQIEWQDHLSIQYSDERGYLRWEVRLDRVYSVSHDGRISGSGGGPAPNYGAVKRLR